MENQCGKNPRHGDPHATPDPRFTIFDCVSFAVEEPEIEAQHGQDK
jgi:hypothetical protein